MRFLTILVLFSFIYIVSCKTHVKALTESMGQEVIEISNPVKELPMGLDEEPLSEKEDIKKPKESPSLKGKYKKMSTVSGKENMKDVDKIDGLNPESEEDRIEKELAEIYKDTADYKSESGEEEVAKEASVDHHTLEPTVQEYKAKYDESADENDEIIKNTDAPIARQRNSFKIHPDSTRKADVERFRTSVEDINCDVNKQLLHQENEKPFTVQRDEAARGLRSRRAAVAEVPSESGSISAKQPLCEPEPEKKSNAFYTTATQLPLFAAIFCTIFKYI
ncbi:uncharacterized protein LOC118281240 isoform X1 [Spodoptera frugiperda]|uniref:Uncharacterized protein LOC118281240 isoform X1 n=1 Tax=Spodoptera frugiperda TaxID=7108 RepID=A0A9R0E066_SPOFR|nr:uncharacterized protein LOC118281240 isoform X1 [Spodoptera frugiperda]